MLIYLSNAFFKMWTIPKTYFSFICRQERNETSTLDESLETLLSQKCNFYLFSSNTRLLSWLVTVLYIEVMFSCVKGGQIAFRDFLKSEFCEENLDFWLACQEFQTFDSPEELTQRAASIYEEFVSTESPKQVKTNSMRWPKNKLKPKYKLSIKRKLVSTCIFNVVFLQEWQLQFFGNS